MSSRGSSLSWELIKDVAPTPVRSESLTVRARHQGFTSSVGDSDAYYGFRSSGQTYGFRRSLRLPCGGQTVGKANASGKSSWDLDEKSQWLGPGWL